VVPRRRRRRRERAPKNTARRGREFSLYLFLRPSVIRTPSPGDPALRRTLVRRHTVGDTILSTDTCRSTSVSLCLSPSSCSLCVRAPPGLSSPPPSLSLSLFLSRILLYRPLLALLCPAGVSPSAPCISHTPRGMQAVERSAARVSRVFAYASSCTHTPPTRTT